MASKIVLHLPFEYSDKLDGKLVHLGTIEKTSWSMRANWCNARVESVEIVRSKNTKDADLEVTFIHSDTHLWVGNYKFSLADGKKSILLPTLFYSAFPRYHKLSGFVAIHVDSTPTMNRKEVTSVIETPIANTLPQLSNDFLNLLNNPDSFPDTTLKCGSEEIAVHKGILSARSPVFAAMFKTRMQEGCGGSVNIVDITPDVLHVMLKYIYSGKIDNLTVLLADDLIFAADKYQLEELKMICINKLKDCLTSENVFRSLVLGDLHDKSLKEHAMDFIGQVPQFSTLRSNQEWKTLAADRPELAIEVLEFVVNYKEQN